MVKLPSVSHVFLAKEIWNGFRLLEEFIYESWVLEPSEFFNILLYLYKATTSNTFALKQKSGQLGTGVGRYWNTSMWYCNIGAVYSAASPRSLDTKLLIVKFTNDTHYKHLMNK